MVAAGRGARHPCHRSEQVNNAGGDDGGVVDELVAVKDVGWRLVQSRRR